MTRPCFLVIDLEHAGSISTRKLVIETAKFNVLTAYSGSEALGTLRRFPALDAVVLDASIQQPTAPELVDQLKQIKPGLPVIAVSAPGAPPCHNADHQLESFDPGRLIELLRRLLPDQAAIVDEHESLLERHARNASV